MLIDWDYKAVTIVGKIVYLTFSVFLVIIMLNLLIAIISNTFANVQETKVATDYKIKS